MSELKSGDYNNMPLAVPSRKNPVRYPWFTMKPGDWFQFESTNLQSCRVKASQMSAQEEKTFQVFVGRDTRKIYCRRVDGIEIVEVVEKDEGGYPIRPMQPMGVGPAPEPAKMIVIGGQPADDVSFDDGEI